MSSQADRVRKVFPVSVLLQFERELLLKHLDGYLLTRSEKLQLEKLMQRLRNQG